jgi:hypothetical protein
VESGQRIGGAKNENGKAEHDFGAYQQKRGGDAGRPCAIADTKRL